MVALEILFCSLTLVQASLANTELLDDPSRNKAGVMPAVYNPNSVVFQFYSKSSPAAPTYITNANFSQAPFNSALDTKILVHGFMSSPSISGLDKAVTGYFSEGDYNVVLVDWSKEASKSWYGFYPEARDDTRWMGTLLASLINVLQTKGAILKKIHCIGHSLGVYVCDRASLDLNKGLGRVTGLDPADPAKNWKGMKGNALFTDVIHTSSFFSGSQAYADADFYLNGGNIQPGCGISDALPGPPLWAKSPLARGL